MKGIYDLYKNYTDVVWDLLEFFSTHAPTSDKNIFTFHSIDNFCEKHPYPNETPDNSMHYPDILLDICDKLCKYHYMELVPNKFHRFQNAYSVSPYIGFWKGQEKNINKHKITSLIFGFEYIYDFYKDIVVPIIYTTKDGDVTVGTGFKIFNGIATARHCIENAQHIAIKDCDALTLKAKSIYVHPNSNIDIAFIDIGNQSFNEIFYGEGKIMQEILTMGYPKIPLFTDFLTAERATISSKAEARLSPSKGNIAAYTTNMLSSIELMLITAKIRGGNSGGPIINEDGFVIGIANQAPYFEGDYDDLGYGIATPIKYLVDMINKKESTLNVPIDYFVDFV